MYIEYLTIAFVLLPLYILVISRLNIRLSTALFIYAYRAIFSIGYLTYAKYDFLLHWIPICVGTKLNTTTVIVVGISKHSVDNWSTFTA